ncbi:hypothetical protein I4U23_025925 [Adineta vaga]|nr:hypothetical protein I4U23_025925 [Adineta vaga]
MSILVKLKNKLQDPSLYETKIREFDECMSLLKTENTELHKRIDQLEALCKTNVNTHQAYFLDEHIRELEEENGKLFAQNQCQREEYVQFLDQLSTMVIRTAVMQENIRKECASIYHVIERLSSVTGNAIQYHHRPIEIDNQLFRSSSNSSSSSSSSTTRCSMSTSDSWTLNTKNMKTPCLISNKSTNQQTLQRSETFIISKLPSPPSMTVTNHNIDRCQTPQPMITATKTIRPSRLPCRRPDSKIQSSTTAATTNRSLSTPKVSKVPVRTTTSLNREQILNKKPSIPVSIISKTEKDTITASNRPITSVHSMSTTTTTTTTTAAKKTARTSPITQPMANKTRICSTTTTTKKNINNQISVPLNKSPRTTLQTIKSNDSIQQMNSTSSESSIEEQQAQLNTLLPILQDEGYSTWSSTDVKDDIKKNEVDDRQKNIGLVKTWLNNSANKQCLDKPVNEVENDKLKEFTQELSDGTLFLCPFVRNRYSNIVPIPLASTPTLSPPKDISLDSLNSPDLQQDTTLSLSSSSSSIFSYSETFEKVLTAETLSNISDDAADTTSSSSATFNMSEYIEDHFIDHDDSASDGSSSLETTILDQSISTKPQKRLLFPGALNHLIFFRRISSDSDLQRKTFALHESENSSHVYHANTINEHSVEVHLINTYGSDTELQVWSHDCAEQRRFLDERQQQQQQQDQEIETKSVDDQQLAVERQILLQQIFEYPWLRPENDLDRPTSINNELSLVSPTMDLIVPSHNPDFYQLCALTNSSSLALSPDQNTRHITAPTTSPILS